jgi:hypothetical protein
MMIGNHDTWLPFLFVSSKTRHSLVVYEGKFSLKSALISWFLEVPRSSVVPLLVSVVRDNLLYMFVLEEVRNNWIRVAQRKQDPEKVNLHTLSTTRSYFARTSRNTR